MKLQKMGECRSHKVWERYPEESIMLVTRDRSYRTGDRKLQSF